MSALHDLQSSFESIKEEIGKVIIGQEEAIEKIFICMLSQGHALLMGVPGLAKTLLVNSISQSISLSFSRIQFTPDLMPSDVTGTEILQNREDGEGREFKFIKGPVFTNVLLADEINRTPPKTQSALLEAMQEKRVTVAGKNHNLQNLLCFGDTKSNRTGRYISPTRGTIGPLHVSYPSRLSESR